MVRLLVEKGADIKAKNKNGGTALDVAAAQKQEMVVRLLKGYGHGYLSKFRPR
jgi:ankyrin repeat protein